MRFGGNICLRFTNMIKFYCAFCKKKIGVPDSFAGKQVKCPKCHLAARVPPVSTPAPPPPSVNLDEITDDPFPSVKSKDLLSLEEPLLPDIPVPLQPQSAQEPKSDEDSDNKPPKTKWIKSVATGTGFGKDLLSLMSPIQSGSDAIAFVFLLILYVLANVDIPILMPLCIWFIARLLLKGYIFIYLFNILLETANGNNHLPEFELPDSYWDMIRTFLQVISSSLYAFLPLIAGIVISVFVIGSTVFTDYISDDSMSEDPYFVQDEEFFDAFPEFDDQIDMYNEPNTIPIEEGFPEDTEDIYTDPYDQADMPSEGLSVLPALVALFFLGLFFWPMIVLNIVLGDTFLVNPVLVIMNIIRTFKAYFICCIAMFAAAGLTYLSIFSFALEGLIDNNFFLILTLIAAVVGGLCVQIYAMRVLGLLYRYHEDNLDW